MERDPGTKVTMLLENNPYPRDVRVSAEAESLVGAGYAVEVIAPRDHGQAARDNVTGVAVRRYRAFDGSGRGAKGLLVEHAYATLVLNCAALLALRRGTAILHLHNPPDTLFPAAAIYRLCGRMVVFDHHDLTPETIDVKFGRSSLTRLARLCERLTFAASTHVISSNESYAAIARARGGKAPRDVTVVRNGPPSAWVRRAMSVRSGMLRPVHIAYVGTISAQDGVDTLASVLEGLQSLRPPIDARLTVVGDGDARPSFERELLRRGVAERVQFVGWAARDTIPALLESADVCVEPAPASEVNQHSTMMKVAEYLALGKPVVAFDLLETRRTVNDAALLVPQGDVDAFVTAVARLARDPDLRVALAAAGQRRAAELTWEHSGRALIDAYASMIERWRRSSD